MLLKKSTGDGYMATKVLPLDQYYRLQIAPQAIQAEIGLQGTSKTQNKALTSKSWQASQTRLCLGEMEGFIGTAEVTQ